MIMDEKYPLNELQEECGVLAFYPVKRSIVFHWSNLDSLPCSIVEKKACGFSLLRYGAFIPTKASNPEEYHGQAVIGHMLYSTAGGQSKQNIQPFFLKMQMTKVSSHWYTMVT